jgi:hypothetical protein
MTEPMTAEPNAEKLRTRLVRQHAEGHDLLDNYGVPRFDDTDGEGRLIELPIRDRIRRLEAHFVEIGTAPDEHPKDAPRRFSDPQDPTWRAMARRRAARLEAIGRPRMDAFSACGRAPSPRG